MRSGCEKKPSRTIELPVLGETREKPAKPKSTISRWRAAGLITLNVLMAIHFLQWRYTGKTVSPIEPSEAMATISNGAINAGFIFFTLAIIATLVLGRFVCGWACHLVALQDLCSWLLEKIGLRPKPFRSRLLVYVPIIVAFYMFAWPLIYRWLIKPPTQPLFPNFTNHLVTTDFWATFPPFWVAVPFLFICGFATVYFLGSKGFCTYGCPYGGVFGFADMVAPGRIRVTDACNSCGHCTAVCTSNVVVHAEVEKYGMVVDPGCMKCMDCVSACPNDALYFGFGKPAAGVKKTLKRSYSLTWTEEIAAAMVFILSYFAVWDAYQLVPMFMALGIAMVTTFIAVRLYRLFTSKQVSFYRYNLRSNGKITTSGLIFAVLAISWLGLNAHTGWIRYHEREGAIAFESVRTPDELALARTNVSPWLTPADKRNIDEGREHFRDAVDLGLFTNKEALSKYAWLEYLGGDTGRALELLDKAAYHQTGQTRSLSLYYRGAILNRSNRPAEAIASLDKALELSPDLVLAEEERGEALWRQGDREAAVAAWQRAVKQNPLLPLSNNFLAVAFAAAGDQTTASAYIQAADKKTPRDPLFHFVLAMRLENLGMTERAEYHFAAAVQMNPQFRQLRSRLTS